MKCNIMLLTRKRIKKINAVYSLEGTVLKNSQKRHTSGWCDQSWSMVASPVLDPYGVVFQEELENVQNRAARFVTGNYNFETGSMTSILEQLGWESLHKRRKGSKSYCYSKV